MPTMIDLFCGAGGMTAGFRAAGFTPVLAADIDPVATATYAANHGEHVVTGSVADLREVPRADLVIGGPPCQGFSALGLRDPDDPRNQLWREYLRVVAAARPAAFVMENVARFAESPEFAMLLGQARPGGTLDGYHLTWGVLNAADYGVPQARKRTILIGTRSPLPGMPEPTTAGRRPTVRNAIAKPWVTGPAAHVVRVDSATNLTRYRHIPPGGNRHDLPAELPDPAGLRPAVGAALTKFAALHPNLVAHRIGPRQVAVSAGRVRALFGYQGDLVPGYPRGTLVRDREGDIWRKGTTWWLWTGRETGTGAGKMRWSDLVRRYGPIELVRMP